MATVAGRVVTFQSKARLQAAINPWTVDEFFARMSQAAGSVRLDFQFDATMDSKKVVPIRYQGVKNLLKSMVYKTHFLTVFYPENPRVPHQLAIAFNRDIKGIAQLTEEENVELFATIKKASEIYNTLFIQGFVITMHDTPQEGHMGRFVVELHPHLPGFHKIKHVMDKYDSNRHALFRTANISSVVYQGNKDHAAFWNDAFQKQQVPLDAENMKIKLPFIREESHHAEGDRLSLQQLLEIFEDNGGNVDQLPITDLTMPVEVPQKVVSVKVEKCFFCDDAVIKRQLVYRYKDVLVFYNARKGAKSGCHFLILPKGHMEKVYSLTSSEVQQISFVRSKLVAVLKEAHPGYDVVVYTQDDPSVGQTVFHTHEQVVAFDPKTIAFTWMFQSVFPPGNVSEEDMLAVRKDFGTRLDQKIKEIEYKEENIA